MKVTIAIGLVIGLFIVLPLAGIGTEMPPSTTLIDNEERGANIEMTSNALSPDESLKKIHLPAGFKAEIVAAEPLLLDPVAFDWDQRGRLWVVEMADYPLGMDGNGQPGGRIRVLEDSDSDGSYDRSTLFADGLNFPNGILTWRDGVIVTASPEILFLQDTDADGRADKKEILISGLVEGNQQLRANGLRWGLDNWVYVAAGSPDARRYGGKLNLKSIRLDREVFVGGRDYRFRPDTGELEPASGPTQFGRNCDNWGHWFGTQNSNPLWHYVLPEHYLHRNPHFGASETLVQLVTPPNPPVYPASSLEKRFRRPDLSGHYTSACGGVIYRDAQLFQDSETHAFICEPFHNLIQHVSLSNSGASFVAKVIPGKGQFDFFASEDRWCRPVMVREAPDGSLWIADMARYMIEHPQFLPPEGKDEMLPHYRRGDDLGRIYRVSLQNMPRFKTVRFDHLSTSDLVTALDTSNGWCRDKVHQILLWRADEDALAPLIDLVEHGKNPLARLHALCVLDGLGGLTPRLVAQVLADPHPGLRENALRVAESCLTKDVLTAAVRLVDDKDAKVLLQLAFLLGESNDEIAGKTLGRLLTLHSDDRLLTEAVMTSATPHLRALVEAVCEGSLANKSQSTVRETLLTIGLGLNDRDAMVKLLSPTFTATDGNYSTQQVTALASLLDQLAQGSVGFEQLRDATNDRLSQLLGNATLIIEQAHKTAVDASEPVFERIAAMSLISRDAAAVDEVLPQLASWLDLSYPSEVQIAAIRVLIKIASPNVLDALADAWPRMSPTARQVTLDGWMSREPWAFDLTERLDRKEIHISALDPANRARLIKHESKRISRLAAKVFDTASSSRGKILESYRPALSLSGDVVRGQRVFIQACALCHKRGTEGRSIGPDMASVVEHPPEKILGSILDPGADIQPGFNPYNCLLNTGEQIYGLLVSENANSIVMLVNDGTKKTVLRNQIEVLKGQNVSFMPEGLEAIIDHQQMADLIAFLRQPIDVVTRPTSVP
ncbi:MAG: PVC-type heme-binding CxxCH protein [Pirellulaceae bacterium]|nr:PVC-type heme-binding CxxCH protein [Pirellulaceae bacterium]